MNGVNTSTPSIYLRGVPRDLPPVPPMTFDGDEMQLHNFCKKGASTLLLDRVIVHYCCPVIVEFHKGSLERG
jgi:hypothetical protein